MTVAAPPALAEDQLEAYCPLPLLADQPARTARFQNGASQAPNHPLYELLVKYVAARTAVTAEMDAGAQTKAKMEALQERCWTLTEEKEEMRTRCEDKLPVTVTFTNTIAKYNPEVADELRTSHVADSDRHFNTLVRIRFECQLVRQKIEDLIADVTSCCCHAAGIQPLTKLEPKMVHEFKSPEHRNAVAALRAVLHVLFAFRRKVIADSTVRFDLAQWLERTLTTALAVGTHECALDLLNHLVRSGNGFGDEFSKYVQFDATWSESAVQVTVALLATFVTPAPTMMESTARAPGFPETLARDESWSVVDNDLGEVTPALHTSTLGESDCLKLLDQFPIKAMMQHFYAELSGQGGSSSDPFPVPAVLRLFGFMNVFFRLICTGLADPVRNRHTHYIRHLSRLGMQSLNLLTSQWREIVTSYLASHLYDPLFHLQAEYDSMVVRLVHRMYSVGKAAAMQFLPHVALDTLSVPGAWAVLMAFYEPQAVPEQITATDPWLKWQHAIQQPSLRTIFYDVLVSSSNIGVYVLSTLARLVQSRHVAGTPLQRLAEWRLISAVGREIFLLGFSNAATAQEHSKTARDLLGAISDHHSFILSDIVDLIHSTPLTISPSYIIKTLPLQRWVPTPSNVRYLGADLQQPLISKLHIFAREAISALNFGLVQLHEPQHSFLPVFFPVSLPADVDQARIMAELPPSTLAPRYALLLPHQLELACAMAQAFATLVPADESLVMSALSSQRKETQKYAMWAWDNVCKFSLHELPITDVDLNPLTDRLRQYAVHPFAQYVRLLVDRPGRDANVFPIEGARILTVLPPVGAVVSALSALYHLLPPHFAVLKRSQSLATLGQFLKMILLFDVRQLSLPTLPGAAAPPSTPAIATRLCDVLVRHIRGSNAHLHVTHSATIRVADRALHAAEFWLRALMQIPEWHTIAQARDCVECVLRSVADVDGSVAMVSDCFVHVYIAGEAAAIAAKQQKWFSFLKSAPLFTLTEEPDEGLLGSMLKAIKQGDGPPTIHPYLLFYALLHETVQEADTRRKLAATVYGHPSIKPDDACEKVGCDYNNLAILRWLKVAMCTDFDHPLHPLFWQGFFALFFASLPINDTATGRTIHRCYGRTFMSKASVLEKIRARLGRATQYWRAKHAELPSPQAKDQLDLFAAMLRWATDDFFTRPDIDVTHLTEAHNFPRFTSMIDAPLDAIGRLDGWLWKDLLLPAHEAMERGLAHTLGQQKWLPLHNNEAVFSLNFTARPALQLQEELERLELGETQAAPAPAAPERFTLLFDLSKPLGDVPRAKASLQSDIEMLLVAAQRHQERLAIAHAITEEYVNLLPTLYANERRPSLAEKRCSDNPNHRGPPCTGAGVVRKDTMQYTMSLDARARISGNRQKYHSLVAERAVPDGFVPCVLRLQRLAEGLAAAVGSGRLASATLAQTTTFGMEAFFLVLSRYTAVIHSYPPAAAAAHEALARLASSFIANNKDAVMTMLLVLLQRSDVVSEFAEYLTPAVAPRSYVGCMQTILRALVEAPVAGSQASTASPALSHRPSQSSQPAGAAASAASPAAANSCQNAQVVQLMIVLRRFDISMWLVDSPPLSERQELMACFRNTFEHITQPASAVVHDVYRPLLALYRDHFLALLGFRFPELFNDALSFVVPLSRKRALPGELWTDLVTVVTARRSVVTGRIATDTAGWLRRQWLEQRSVGPLPDQLEAWRPYIPAVVALIKLLADGMRIEEMGLPAVFAVVASMLDPWLVGLPGKPHPVSSSPACLDAAAQICNVLIELMLQPAVSKPAALALFMEFYFKSLKPGAPSHVLNLFHRVFLPLPYSSLFLTPPLLHTVRAALSEDRDMYLAQSASFFSAILMQVSWPEALVALQTQEHEAYATLAYFVDNTLNTCVLLASVGDPLTLTNLRTLLPQILGLPYEYLHHQAFATALFPLAKLPPASIFDANAALPMIIRLLRAGAQFDATGKVDLANVTEKRLAFVRALTDVLRRAAPTKPTETVDYFTQFLQDIVQSLQQVQADYPRFTLLLGSAMGLLTSELSSKLSDDLRSALVVIAEAHPPLALAVLQAACRSLAWVKDMVLVVEACIDVHFSAQHDLSPSNQFGWLSITSFFETPDLLKAEFIEAAVTHGCWGTLYAHARQVMQRPMHLPAVDELYLQVLSWVKRCQPQASNPVLEAKLILLIEMLLDVLVHLRRNGFESPAEPRLLALAETLDRLGNDSKPSSNFLQRLVAPPSVYSPAFRLYMRALAAFCAYQVLENNTLRIVAPGLPSPRASKTAEKYLTALSSSKTAKPYVGLVEVIDIARALTLDPQMMLSTHSRMCEQLLPLLFGENVYLKILFLPQA